MKRYFFFFLYIISLRAIATEAELNFFNSIRPLSYIRGYIPKDSIFTGYNGNGLIIRSEYNGWMFIGEGTGWVCKLDSGQWKRIDDTYFRGYDFGAYPFMTGGIDIYKYGGYGFWKTNGILTCFDYKKKEWEIVNTSPELPNVNRYCFFDEEMKKLYQLGSLTFNQSDNKAVFSDSVYILQLDEHVWKTAGKIASELDSIDPARLFEPNGTTLPAPNGFLFVSEKSTPFLLDFKKMNVSFFAPSANEKIHDLFRRMTEGNVFTVVQKEKISLVNRETLEEEFSLRWDQFTSGMRSINLIQTPEPQNESKAWIYVLGSLIAISALFFFFRKNKKTENKKHNAILSVNGQVTINGKDVSTYLSAEEFVVLKTIAEAQVSGEPVTTQKINEILGIENRTLDGQKNYRSEVIKSINSKIRLNERLEYDPIIRERAADDKRMMSYRCTLSLKKI